MRLLQQVVQPAVGRESGIEGHAQAAHARLELVLGLDEKLALEYLRVEFLYAPHHRRLLVVAEGDPTYHLAGVTLAAAAHPVADRGRRADAYTGSLDWRRGTSRTLGAAI